MIVKTHINSSNRPYIKNGREYLFSLALSQMDIIERHQIGTCDR